MKILLGILFFLSGAGMWWVLAELLGWYSLIITLPLAFGIGWTTAGIMQMEDALDRK